jgi:dTDP-4-amino-4,6-dideoxygalactose transaminase
MIPRVKPNYTILDLLFSLFKSNNSSLNRNTLIYELKKYFSNNNSYFYILLTPSGRSAIYILLSCINRSKVFIPAYTCKAVVEACKLANKYVYYLDIEKNKFNVDASNIDKKLDNNSIFLLTHQFGFPGDLDQLLPLALKSGAMVVEDCAASFGGKYRGQILGTFGEAAVFSFDSTKLLNTPLKGGFILTSNPDLFTKCNIFIKQNLKLMPLFLKLYYIFLAFILKLISNHSLYKIFHWFKFERKNLYTDEAKKSLNILNNFYTYKFSEFQAYITLKQLYKIDTIINKRLFIYTYFLSNLKNPLITLPPCNLNNEWVPIRFPILINDNKLTFYSLCIKEGLDLGFSFTFIDCPSKNINSYNIANSILNLPFYYNLSDKEIFTIVSILNNISISSFR